MTNNNMQDIIKIYGVYMLLKNLGIKYIVERCGGILSNDFGIYTIEDNPYLDDAMSMIHYGSCSDNIKYEINTKYYDSSILRYKSFSPHAIVKSLHYYSLQKYNYNFLIIISNEDLQQNMEYHIKVKSSIEMCLSIEQLYAYVSNMGEINLTEAYFGNTSHTTIIRPNFLIGEADWINPKYN